MKNFIKSSQWILFSLWILAWTFSAYAHEEESVTFAVVGDTGIGERAYAPGFMAVQQAMRDKKPDGILHLGDFVYQPDFFPKDCPDRYIEQIKNNLVAPYPVRIFVAGDNDLPPVEWKPKASGCWDKIRPMATPFDSPGQQGPGELEGTVEIGNALFVILNIYDWKNPEPWLKPIIERAREKGRWIIFCLHEPPLTTAWFIKDRLSLLKEIEAFQPDLVLSGNQHSYERFSPTGIKKKDALTVSYERGKGPVLIVSGGGGATFKPFADMQGKKKRTAPKEVFDRLEVRGLIHHFLTLKIGHEALEVSAFRVCAPEVPDTNPRWHADDEMWKKIPLPCNGQPTGVTKFDGFKILDLNH